MEVQYAGASSSFMEVINILCDNADIEIFLKFRQSGMSGIRLTTGELLPALVVESEHELGILMPAFRSGHFADFILFPQAAGISESLNAAFSAHTGAGKNY